MRRVALLLIVVLAALLAVEVFYSLAWPIAHDEAPLLYQAFLMLTEAASRTATCLIFKCLVRTRSSTRSAR